MNEVSIIFKTMKWLSKHAPMIVSEIADPNQMIGIFDKCCQKNISREYYGYYQCIKCNRLFIFKKPKLGKDLQ